MDQMAGSYTRRSYEAQHHASMLLQFQKSGSDGKGVALTQSAAPCSKHFGQDLPAAIPNASRSRELPFGRQNSFFEQHRQKENWIGSHPGGSDRFRRRTAQRRVKIRVGRFVERSAKQAVFELLQFGFLCATEGHRRARRHVEACRRFEPGSQFDSICLHKSESFIGRKHKTHECLGNRGFRKSLLAVLKKLPHDAEGAGRVPAGQASLAGLGAHDFNVRHQLHGGKRQERGSVVKDTRPKSPQFFRRTGIGCAEELLVRGSFD